MNMVSPLLGLAEINDLRGARAAVEHVVDGTAECPIVAGIAARDVVAPSVPYGNIGIRAAIFAGVAMQQRTGLGNIYPVNTRKPWPVDTTD